MRFPAIVLLISALILLVSPISPISALSVDSVTCGRSHSLARLSDGSILAWGRSDAGQSTIPTYLDVKQMSAGEFHSLLLLENGTVVGVGRNDYGALKVPSGLTNVNIVSTSVRHSLVRRNDSTAVGFGSNTGGESTVPNEIQGRIAQLSATYLFSVYRLTDGTVRVIGTDSHGQISNQPRGLTNVTHISAGFAHILALKSDGSIVCWGSNTQGECEIPSSLTPGTVRTLKAATHASFAVLVTGGIVAWGAVKTSELPPDVQSRATSVAAGEYMMLALVGEKVAAVGYGNPEANRWRQLEVPVGISAGSYKVGVANQTVQASTVPVGAIVGAVLGVLMLAGVIGGLVYWRKKKGVKGGKKEVVDEKVPDVFAEAVLEAKVVPSNGSKPAQAVAQDYSYSVPVNDPSAARMEPVTPIFTPQQAPPPIVAPISPVSSSLATPTIATPPVLPAPQPIDIVANPIAAARIRSYFPPPAPPQALSTASETGSEGQEGRFVPMDTVEMPADGFGAMDTAEMPVDAMDPETRDI